jgi:hypothetical protein
MDFTIFNTVHQIESGDSVYADAVNHCKNYRNYLVARDKPSSVHECTHGIQADLRNGAIQLSQPGTLTVGTCKMPVPIFTDVPGVQAKTNAFYVLKNRAIRVPEPNTRKSACVQYISSTMRYGRYNLYVAGQREWDDTPLYLFDEWNAYVNGAECVIDMFRTNSYDQGQSDFIFGPIEFVAYAVATLMAARAVGALDETLKWFSKWNLQRTFEVYLVGIKLLPWAEADKCYNQLKAGAECASMRAFLKTELDFEIPTGINPPPPQVLDWVM